MGWNEVEWSDMKPMHDPEPEQPQCYYFVHSFYPDPENESIVAGRTEYGRSFCCAIRSGDIFGVQFHPEKSQFAGLDLLSNYLDTLNL
jgi:glutamine amidotransferase